MRTRIGIVIILLAVAMMAPALPVTPFAQAFQGTSTLQVNSWPTYLGPEVVIAGSVTDDLGVPDVLVVVRERGAGGAIIFDGPATLALRPPLGSPAASWRVPLTLVDGEYDATVVSSRGGDVLATSEVTFEVVSAIEPPLVLIEPDAMWSYYDAGNEPPGRAGDGNLLLPTVWYEPAYDANEWATGSAELGYGDQDEATVTASTGIFGQPIIAQYFRHEFTPADLADYDTLTLSLLRDDGAVVYLNGTELGRTNMPAGSVNYGTAALTVSEQTISISIDPAELVAGSNLIAVEVHQSSPTSTDLSFSATLTASTSDTPRVSNNTEGAFVLAAGDMARCNFDGDEAVAAQMGELFDTDRGLFIGLGDLVYNSGTIDEFVNCYDPTIGQFRNVTWPSPGNHEHYTTPNAAGYRQYFGPAAGPLAGPNGGLWYSFDVDDYWHVIALDSDCRFATEPLPGAFQGDGCAVGSEQEAWLRADLEANQDKNILAFFHHPPYTNNRYTDHLETWPLWQALAEYGAELTLHGHEHHYERYVPLNYYGVPTATGGMTEFIIGSGGTNPRYNQRPQESESAFRGTFPQGTNDFGVMQLWLQPDGYEWKWESINGLADVDQGRAGLNPPMPATAISGVTFDVDNDVAIAGVEVCARKSLTRVQTCDISDADGSYEITVRVPGTYRVITQPTAGDLVMNESVSIDVAPPAPQIVPINLVPRPVISGTVTSSLTSAPLAGASVCASRILGEPDRCAITTATGSYEITGLEIARQYRVSFDAADHMAECYDNQLGDCTFASDPVNLGFVDKVGIDAGLDLDFGGIVGRVVAGDTQRGLAGIQVCARRPIVQSRCTLTGADGSYRIDDLLSRSYDVEFRDTSGTYLSQCYDDFGCNNLRAVRVTQPDDTTGVDAELHRVGDVNCDQVVDLLDALALAQFSAGERTEAPTCGDVAATSIFAAAGDINADRTTDDNDTQLLLQMLAETLTPDG